MAAEQTETLTVQRGTLNNTTA